MNPWNFSLIIWSATTVVAVGGVVAMIVPHVIDNVRSRKDRKADLAKAHEYRRNRRKVIA